MNTKRTLQYIAILLVASSSHVLAAGQGDLGTQSTGTSTISVTTTELVQMTNVGDVSFGNYPGTYGTANTVINKSDDVCIYTNDTNTRYKVTASGGGSGYQLVNGGSTIPYQVKWYPTTSEGSPTTLESGTTNWAPGTGTATGFTNATNTWPCSTDNARFEITINQSDLLAVPANSYTGTLTLIVMPDDN